MVSILARDACTTKKALNQTAFYYYYLNQEESMLNEKWGIKFRLCCLAVPVKKMQRKGKCEENEDHPKSHTPCPVHWLPQLFVRLSYELRRADNLLSNALCQLQKNGEITWGSLPDGH